MTSYTANWNYPTQMQVGPGQIKNLPTACKMLGMSSPLLVTDPGLANLEIVDNAIDNCQKQGLKVAKFYNIQGNPTGENVTDGVAAFVNGKHDGVIAFGGGSALDAAKAVALMIGQNHNLWDFEDVGDNWKQVNVHTMAPVVAVPTTAGTGSEVGRASVITDTENHVKKIIFHPNMLPATVILDPELTTGLPPHITAATGMDALSHNLEALCSPFYHPMAQGIAFEGIRLVKNHLLDAYKDGNNIDARSQMLVASSMGATAFQKGLGGMHALAHSLGAVYGAHHGLLNAILMPYVLVSNQTVISGKLTRLCLYLEIDNPGFNSFLEWILELREALGIVHTLQDIDIDTENAALIGKMAHNDPSAGGNPLNFSTEQYKQIFVNAVKGTL